MESFNAHDQFRDAPHLYYNSMYAPAPQTDYQHSPSSPTSVQDYMPCRSHCDQGVIGHSNHSPKVGGVDPVIPTGRSVWSCEAAHGHRRVRDEAPTCNHELCRRIYVSNLSDKKARLAHHHTALLLISTVNGKPAVLLTRGACESEYGMTAGPRMLQDSTGQQCFVRGALEALSMDTGVSENEIEDKIDFYSFRRLFGEKRMGLPVLIGRLAEQDMMQLLVRAGQRPYPQSSTRLFRISHGNSAWRIVSQSDVRHITDKVRCIVAQIDF